MSEITGNEGGRILNRVMKGILDIMYPRRCAICDQVLAGQEKYLCRHCISLPNYIGENHCMKCGKPVKDEEECCMDCKEKNTTYLYGRAVFLYDHNMRSSISRFKYHGRQEYAGYYAYEMYKKFEDWMKYIRAEALIPVPIHKERYRQRGFNQAELIAKELSYLSNIPVLSGFLLRVKNTMPQKDLSDKERIQNLHEAFQIALSQEKLYKELKCVIIIDDIYTTGSTMEICSQILKKWGIEKIYFLCVCIGQGI